MSSKPGHFVNISEERFLFSVAAALFSFISFTQEAVAQSPEIDTVQQSTARIVTLEVSAFGRDSADALINIKRTALRIYLEKTVGHDFIFEHNELIKSNLLDKSDDYVIGIHISEENRYLKLLEIAARVNLDESAVERMLKVIQKTDVIDRSVMRN